MGFGQARDGRHARNHFTVPVIQGHYCGDTIIGLYAVSRENSCRFMVFDVDSHGDDPSDAHEMAARVRAFLEASGIPYLEEDSDGQGGRHFWVRFAEVLPAGQVCGVIRQIKAASGINKAEPLVPLLQSTGSTRSNTSGAGKIALLTL